MRNNLLKYASSLSSMNHGGFVLTVLQCYNVLFLRILLRKTIELLLKLDYTLAKYKNNSVNQLVQIQNYSMI